MMHIGRISPTASLSSSPPSLGLSAMGGGAQEMSSVSSDGFEEITEEAFNGGFTMITKEQFDGGR
jgi:hypothetical protein